MKNDSLENPSPKDLKARQDEFLALVPDVNGIGNKALKKALRVNFVRGYWTDDMYWTIQNSLVDRGDLKRAKGNGGSVRRADQSNELTDKIVIDYKTERELYDPIVAVLENVWAKDQGFDDCHVLKIADGGSKYTNGKWTRPDIVAVGCKTFSYVPGKHLDVITFEVKPANAIDISGVYEALAHRRAASRSYLIVHIPTAADLCRFNATDIVEEAGKFGIGVIVAEDPTNYYTWDFKLEAQRIEPDPYKLNDFIAQQVSAELKEKIEEWVKAK